MIIITAILSCLITCIFAQFGPITIEVRFERLENPLGVQENGKRCDVLSACDMRVQFHVDTESALDVWPGKRRNTDSWYLIDLPGDTNMVALMKTLIAKRDSGQYIVDGDKVYVDFRALVHDRDVITPYDVIERFDCAFKATPAESVVRAEWFPPLDQSPFQCHGEIHFPQPVGDRPTVYYRYRMYKTDPNFENEIAESSRIANDGIQQWEKVDKVFNRNP